MQPGTVIYARRECQNWKQYQIVLIITERRETKLGVMYITNMIDGTTVWCFASEYFAGKKEIAVKKTPWKDLPMFHTAERAQGFVNANLLERS